MIERTGIELLESMDKSNPRDRRTALRRAERPQNYHSRTPGQDMSGASHEYRVYASPLGLSVICDFIVAALSECQAIWLHATPDALTFRYLSKKPPANLPILGRLLGGYVVPTHDQGGNWLRLL